MVERETAKVGASESENDETVRRAVIIFDNLSAIYDRIDKVYEKPGKFIEADEREIERLQLELAEHARAYSSINRYGPKRKYWCPVCELYTLDRESPGSNETCPVCGWIDDKMQFSEQDSQTGQNEMSLNEARDKWRDNES